MPHASLSPIRERQLMDKVHQGDQGALGELMGAYSRGIYHLCLRMVHNAEDAADLTQDTLVKAVENIATFRADSRFSTWLYRIAMNLTISYLRKRAVRATVSLETSVSGKGQGQDQATELKALLADGREPDPAQSVQDHEQVSQMIRALDGLEIGLRSVILLRDLQGLDYEQIGQVLSLPVGTVKSRLFRARLALRMSLEGPAAQDGSAHG